MEVIVKKSEVEGEATPPPSKSYTHRAFFAAALSKKTIVENPLYSGDTLSTLRACEFLGAKVKKGELSTDFEGVEEVNCEGYVNVENSGTTLRILLGLLAHSPWESVADGDESLRKRPNKALALALKKLGADVKSDSPSYTAPITVRGKIRSGDVEMRAESSQFVTSLLYTLPLCDEDSVLKVVEVKSRPYLDITIHVLKSAGIHVEVEKDSFFIPGDQSYRLRTFRVPSDFSSASYLIAAGVLAGKVIVKEMYDTKQGDRRIVDILREMGGKVRWNKESGTIEAERSELEGIEVDASDVPDLVPTIAVLAAVAKGKTVIKNAEHLRIKEIDRIKGCCENLKALGVEVEESRDGFTILGSGKIEGGIVNSFGDHRMALAFSLLGLVSKRGVRVKNAEVVSVSFPEYFDVLKNLGARVLLTSERPMHDA